MNSRERVKAVITGEKADRMPVYAWVKANLTDQIGEVFGSVEAFEDKYEFDFAHLFSELHPHSLFDSEKIRAENNGEITPQMLLDMELSNPDDMDLYDSLKKEVAHHKDERERFVYVQTPGIFEGHNGVFTIENHLMYLVLYEKELHEVYKRQVEWVKRYAMNCLDLGIDMIHVSDDWGAQTGLMFSPDTWKSLIAPYIKSIADAVKQRGAFLSLHCDGNANQILDGIVDLGFDAVHPFQESAGMDYSIYKEKYADKFVIMGGLDVQTAIGFGDMDKLKSEIERVVGMFKEGNMLYCTTHFVQDHCSIDELIFAYDLIYRLVRD